MRALAAVAAAALGARTHAWNNGVSLPMMGFANWVSEASAPAGARRAHRQSPHQCVCVPRLEPWLPRPSFRSLPLAVLPCPRPFSQNLFGCDYNDTTFRQLADAMVSTGLRDAGYEYMLVQECIVPAGARDQNGVVMPDPVKFPYGLANLADYFHSKGLKAGIYTDVAWRTCANYEGSGPGPSDPEGHWEIDALTYAQWGYDLIEADFCNTQGTNLTAPELYTRARDAIAAASAATGRTVALYICNWGVESPWEWAAPLGNAFRNTPDICAPGSIAWGSILSNFDHTVIHSGSPPLAPGLPGTGLGAVSVLMRIEQCLCLLTTHPLSPRLLLSVSARCSSTSAYRGVFTM